MPPRPPQETRMITVPAGPDNNDIYHIPVCGLKFGTTWQQLKDFTRMVTDVIHAEVFPASTTGWIKVQGYENFEKAFQHLNGGVLNGSCIIASDRNRTMPISIKDVVVTGRGGQSDYLASATSGYGLSDTNYGCQLGAYHTGWGAMPTAPTTGVPIMDYINPSPAGYEQHAVAPMPPGTNYGYSTSNLTAYQAATYTQPTLATNTAHHHSYYPSTMERLPSIGAGQYAPETTIHTTSPVTTANSATPTATRRVLIKSLPRRETTEAFLRDLVRTHVSADAAADVEDIDIGLDHNGKPKGYAFVHFRTFEIAMRAVAVFDGLKMPGADLEARMSVEGEAALNGKHPRRDKNSSDRKDRKEVKDPGFGYVGQHVAGSSSSAAAEMDPDVDEISAEKEKHRRKKEAPVIVDGSTSRHKKTSDKKRRS